MKLILAAALTVALGTRALSAEEPESVKSLRTLVELNSGTANRGGVDEVQAWIAERLKELGFQVELKPNPAGADKSGRLLIGTLKGSSSRFITLITHSDTVFEPSSPFQKLTVSDDGKRAMGPGVIDAKGGIVVALDGLRAFLKARPKPDFSIRFVSSPAEETGSAGFLDDLRAFARDTRLVLGFEPALDDGSIIRSRRGDRWYHIKVVGKEAHAGRAHGDGINACVELSEKLARISKLTDYKSDVTVSVGRMSGGQDKFNIVCGTAEAKVDTRFARLKDMERLHERIERILKEPGVRSAKTGETAKVSYELADDCPPFSESAESKPFLRAYLKTLEEVEGRKVEAKSSGGAADSNYLSSPGVAIIDGLGPVGGKLHTPEEYLVVSSLESRARAFAAFLMTLKW